MTYEDVKRIRDNPCFLDDVDNKKLSSLIDKAIEKQIPKKLRHKKLNGKDFLICPTCDDIGILVPVDFETLYFYCTHCGQRIDWSEI